MIFKIKLKTPQPSYLLLEERWNNWYVKDGDIAVIYCLPFKYLCVFFVCFVLTVCKHSNRFTPEEYAS